MKNILMSMKAVEITFRDTSEAALAYYAMKAGKLDVAIDWRLGWRRLYYEGFCPTTDIMNDSLAIEAYINDNQAAIVR